MWGNAAKGLHCRQGRAQSTLQLKAGSGLWGKAPISHCKAAGYSALQALRPPPSIRGELLKPGLQGQCYFTNVFFLRPSELVFSWLHGAVMERIRFKSLISPIWIDLNFPWPCPDHWAGRSASCTEPSGRLEAKGLQGPVGGPFKVQASDIQAAEQNLFFPN